MSSLRAYAQAALTGIGVLVALAGGSLAASIDVPPGGGDIPTGFAFLFSWAVVGVGIAIFATGLLLLYDGGLGAYFTHHQRRFMRAGGACLLLGALAPLLGLLAVPLLLTGFGPGAGSGEALLSTLLLAWVSLFALGGLGVLVGLGWRLVDALADLVDAGIPGQH